MKTKISLPLDIPNIEILQTEIRPNGDYIVTMTNQEVLTNPLIIEDGFGKPPEGPGWGTDLDDAVLAKYPPTDFIPVEHEPYLAF